MTWTMDGDIAPGGYAPPNAVVAIVGLELHIEGYDQVDLIPGGPRHH